MQRAYHTPLTPQNRREHWGGKLLCTPNSKRGATTHSLQQPAHTWTAAQYCSGGGPFGAPSGPPRMPCWPHLPTHQSPVIKATWPHGPAPRKRVFRYPRGAVRVAATSGPMSGPQPYAAPEGWIDPTLSLSSRVVRLPGSPAKWALDRAVVFCLPWPLGSLGSRLPPPLSSNVGFLAGFPCSCISSPPVFGNGACVVPGTRTWLSGCFWPAPRSTCSFSSNFVLSAWP